MSLANFYYGAYVHAPQSVAIRNITKTYTLGANQRVHILRINWTLEGKLISTANDEGADIQNQLSHLIAAYAYNGFSAGFTGTVFYMDTSQTIGGVLVSSPINHDGIRGAEGVTYLKYSFGLQADFPYAVSGTVLAFSESLSFTDNDGGPTYAERMPMQGAPILQQVTTQSWFYATQSGSITAAFAPPNVPDPTFGFEFIRTGGGGGRTVTYKSPVMSRGIPISYTTDYRYEFINNSPLLGTVNIIQ